MFRYQSYFLFFEYFFSWCSWSREDYRIGLKRSREVEQTKLNISIRSSNLNKFSIKLGIVNWNEFRNWQIETDLFWRIIIMLGTGEGGISLLRRRQAELNQHNSITVTYSPLRNRSNPQPFTNAAFVERRTNPLKSLHDRRSNSALRIKPTTTTTTMVARSIAKSGKWTVLIMYLDVIPSFWR